MNNYIAELDKLDQTIRQKEAEKIRAEERVRTGEAKLAEVTAAIGEHGLTPENIGQAISVLDNELKAGLARANDILDGKGVIADPEFADGPGEEDGPWAKDWDDLLEGVSTDEEDMLE